LPSREEKKLRRRKESFLRKAYQVAKICDIDVAVGLQL
jgi:hypothetical protein